MVAGLLTGLVVFVLLVPAMVTGHLAGQKGRSQGAYFALSLFFTPIVGLIAVAAAPRVERQTGPQRTVGPVAYTAIGLVVATAIFLAGFWLIVVR